MSYPGAPLVMPDALQWCRRLAEKINDIMQGRTNNYGTVTLTASSATTVITFAKGRLSTNSTVYFWPTTANAAADFGAGTMYESARAVASNTLTLTHANNANADKTFRYAIIG